MNISAIKSLNKDSLDVNILTQHPAVFHENVNQSALLLNNDINIPNWGNRLSALIEVVAMISGIIFSLGIILCFYPDLTDHISKRFTDFWGPSQDNDDTLTSNRRSVTHVKNTSIVVSDHSQTEIETSTALYNERDVSSQKSETTSEKALIKNQNMNSDSSAISRAVQVSSSFLRPNLADQLLRMAPSNFDEDELDRIKHLISDYLNTEGDECNLIVQIISIVKSSEIYWQIGEQCAMTHLGINVTKRSGVQRLLTLLGDVSTNKRELVTKILIHFTDKECNDILLQMGKCERLVQLMKSREVVWLEEFVDLCSLFSKSDGWGFFGKSGGDELIFELMRTPSKDRILAMKFLSELKSLAKGSYEFFPYVFLRHTNKLINDKNSYQIFLDLLPATFSIFKNVSKTRRLSGIHSIVNTSTITERSSVIELYNLLNECVWTVKNKLCQEFPKMEITSEIVELFANAVSSLTAAEIQELFLSFEEILSLVPEGENGVWAARSEEIIAVIQELLRNTNAVGWSEILTVLKDQIAEEKVQIWVSDLVPAISSIALIPTECTKQSFNYARQILVGVETKKSRKLAKWMVSIDQPFVPGLSFGETCQFAKALRNVPEDLMPRIQHVFTKFKSNDIDLLKLISLAKVEEFFIRTDLLPELLNTIMQNYFALVLQEEEISDDDSDDFDESESI